MDWPRVRFTLAMVIAVTLGFMLGLAEAVMSWRLERWQIGKR